MASLEEVSQQLNKAFPKDLARFSTKELDAVRSLIAQYVAILINLDNEEKVKAALVDSKLGDSKVNFLHIAAKFGYELEIDDILKFINDVNYVNVRDVNLFTPLHYAARNGWIGIVKILLANGAEVSPRTSKESREWTPVHHAARGGHIEIVQELLNAGADKEVKTGFGLNILHVACEYSHPELVRLLLSMGLDKNYKTIDDNRQMTCLHYAAINGNEEIVSDLLKAGSDRNAMMSDGFSVLEIAAKNNHLNVVKLLLQWGSENWSHALEIAKEFKAEEIVKEIELYEEAKKNLFKNLSSINLLRIFREFNEQNLSEGKEIGNGFILNAHGILALKSKIGLLKKTEITLEEVAQKEGMAELLQELNRLKSLTKRS